MSLQHEARAGVFLVAQFHVGVVGIVSVVFGEQLVYSAQSVSSGEEYL